MQHTPPSHFLSQSELRKVPAVIELEEHAKRLGLMFKIDGLPFGANYATHLATLNPADANA